MKSSVLLQTNLLVLVPGIPVSYGRKIECINGVSCSSEWYYGISITTVKFHNLNDLNLRRTDGLLNTVFLDGYLILLLNYIVNDDHRSALAPTVKE